MMKSTNIIIVSDVPPDSKYTAGQVLHQAISGLPEFNFRFYWFNQSSLDTRIQLPANCSLISTFGVAYGRLLGFLIRAFGYVGRRAPFLYTPLLLLKGITAALSLASTAFKLGRQLRKDKANFIWFVIQGERSVICYTVAAWIAGKPYLLHQWDPLSWWMGHRHYPHRFLRIVSRLLSRLEARAVVNIVPSDAWCEQLTAQGKHAIRLDNFVKHELLDEGRFFAVKEPAVFHAVFVGQFYADAELMRMVFSLTEVLRLHGRELVVHLFGSSTPVTLHGCRVVSHGYLDRDALIRRISKWDLALLPYPTEPGYEETARLSFPSKARVYLAAGLPILSLAPDFSGVHRFLSDSYAAHYSNLAMNSNVRVFIDSLQSASYQDRRSRFMAARELVRREFSDTTELAPLKNILGEAA